MRLSKKVTEKRNRERKNGLDRRRTGQLVEQVFGGTLHAKRVESLANQVTGTLRAARMSVHAIGAAYAAVADIAPKHGIKQVDRFLSNEGFNVEQLLPAWAEFVLGPRQEVVIALDWTDFDGDKQTTLAAYVITSHGRATPLYWKTYAKATLKGNRTRYEEECIDAIHRAIPKDVDIILLADRGFGSQELYELLALYGWNYVIRFRGNIEVINEEKESRPAAEWLSATGRAKKLVNARVTKDQTLVPAVVVVHNKQMKDPWCLATSLSNWTASRIVKLYGKRFRIEETFRDQKDLHFGKGLSASHIRSPMRRDRLLLLAAIAQAFLTLLGAACEKVGLDRLLKANTSKKRTHSLFRQGTYWYNAIPTMPEEWLRPWMRAAEDIIKQHLFATELFAIL